MLLSVLSALARLNVDPWQEAAKLAGLPAETAIQRLGSLIAALPGGPSTQPDARAIAARLIALLPRHAGSDIASPKWRLGASAGTNPWAVVLFYMLFMLFMLGAQFAAGSRHQPARVAHVQALTSTSTSPHIPPPGFGP